LVVGYFTRMKLYRQVTNRVASRAGLNERELPGKVVTARPPKRFA